MLLIRFSVVTYILALLLSGCASTPSTNTAAVITRLSADTTPESVYNESSSSKISKPGKAVVTHFAVDFTSRSSGQSGSGSGASQAVANIGAVLRVSDSTLQEITDNAYDYFNKKFSEVTPIEPYNTLKVYEKFGSIGRSKLDSKLRTERELDGIWEAAKKGPGTHAKLFTPTGQPLLAAIAGNDNDFMSFYKVTDKLNATVIDMQFTLDFAEYAAAGGGDRYENTASIEVRPRIYVRAATLNFFNGSTAGSVALKSWPALDRNDWLKQSSKQGSVVAFEVDQEKFKSAAIETLKAHIDLVVARIKKEM